MGDDAMRCRFEQLTRKHNDYSNSTGSVVNKFRLRAIPLVLMSMVCARTFADDSNKLFDDRFYVAPVGSIARSLTSSESNLGYGGGVAIGKSVVPHLGVEILGDYLYYHGRSTTTAGTGLLCGLLSSCPDVTTTTPGQRILAAGLGANVYWSPTNYGVFVHGDAEGGNRFVYNGGAGVDLPLGDGAFAIRAEALYHKERNFNAAPLYHLGFRIPFGGLPPPAAAPPEPPPEVVPVEAPPPPPAEPSPSPPAPPPCQSPVPGQPVNLDGCKTGDTLVLHGVNFEFNKAKLTLNAKALLDQIADALLARKDIKVEVDGYTDGVGGAAYNQRLSEARAAAVMKYLVGRGIDAGRMTSKGFGKSMPIADNGTEEGREQNRRVELRVTESGGVPGSASETPVVAPVDAGTATPPAPAIVHRAKRHRKSALTAPDAAVSAAPPPEQSAPEPAADNPSPPPAPVPTDAGPPVSAPPPGDAAAPATQPDDGSAKAPDGAERKVDTSQTEADGSSGASSDDGTSKP